MVLAQFASFTAGTSSTVVLGSQIKPIDDQVAVVEVREEYTIPELIKKISGRYGIDSTLALDIARCESRLQQFREDGSLVRGKKNPHDIGVFQINEEYHLERSRANGFDIYTAAGNIEYAMWLMKYDGDRHWHWSQGCWES